MPQIGLGRLILCLVGTCLAAGGAATAQPAAEWEPVTADRLLAPEDGDWMSYRRTYDVTGFSPLDQINRSNVGDLRLVWSYSMRDVTGWGPDADRRQRADVRVGKAAAGSPRSTSCRATSRWVHTRSYPEDIELSQAFMRHRGRVRLRRHDLLGHGRCRAGCPRRADGASSAGR